MVKYSVSRLASAFCFVFLLGSITWLTVLSTPKTPPEDSTSLPEPDVAFDVGEDSESSKPTPSFPLTNDSLLGIASHIYVVSLPQREDRREQMEFLRAIQGLTWTVIDAVAADSPVINRILDWVIFQRTTITEHVKSDTASAVFHWPTEINALSVIQDPLEELGADLWIRTMPPISKGHHRPTSSARPNLTCAVEDYSIPAPMDNTPEWIVLSPAKIACWYSHVNAIRQFVQRPNGHIDDVVVILEDDIDMEKDIKDRLSRIWPSLPPGWDMVFLGHCWSNESSYPALKETNSYGINISTFTANTVTHIHPSFAPKCTHAYALSHSGARRVLQHLRYSPFAYSRALDQALAWLIRSGRLRSYSVVPSVVVQRKTVSSDVMPGMGSTWREGLQNGVFGS